MKRKAHTNPAPHKEGLVIRPGTETPLSRTQVEFNRLMKSLETTKARHASEQARLDDALATAIRELMPLIEDLNRVNRDFVVHGRKAWQTLKLSAKRRLWFGDLLTGKAADLLGDPVGLAAEEIAELEAIIDELNPGGDEPQMDESGGGELDFVRKMMEQAAREAGLDLDLSGLETSGDPEEFQRMANERLRAAFAAAEGMTGSPAAAAAQPPRKKPTKAEATRERKRLEQEEAKNRDLKSLFKQLAKAFHPDLEPDPLLREHKKVWMQRLNTAYAANDLREMLQLEMEWLGEEVTNLATAGDEKLKVYCMVLKEQIVDLKRQTHFLLNEPQYGPLQRFRDHFYGTIANPKTINRELRQELIMQREVLEIISKENAQSRQLIYEIVDEHARRPNYLF